MLKIRLTKLIVLALVTGIFALGTFARAGVSENANGKSGSLKGVVLDAETKSPIIGATVMIVGTDLGAATDDEGRFRIKNLPIGDCAVKVSSVGYEPFTATDVIIRSGRVANLEVALRMSMTEVTSVQVTSGYFVDSPTEPTSSTRYSNEEIRRAPGSAGDVSRIMFSLPSVAKVNDNVNNLIVRGGSPTENSFYLENIEIPNINHYPLFGTSGGPISLLNTDFIQDATFSAGGFSSAYGDRLSSIMEINFREGNRDEVDLQADMNFAGFGVTGEGPIGNGRGSWMGSVRRSYLDLLTDAIGTGVVPRYSDYQGKMVLDLNSKNRLTFLGVVGIDYIDFDRESSIEDGYSTYGKTDGYEYAAGVNWRYLWGSKGYSNTSLSYLATRDKANYLEASTGNELVTKENLDGAAQLRNVNFYRLSNRHEVQFGFDFKYELDKFDQYTSEYTNFFGDTIPSYTLNYRVESPKVGGFASYVVQLSRRLQATFGGRFDYYEYTGNSSFSPRATLSYKLTETSKLNSAFGIYHQTLPTVLLSQQESNKELADPKAYHYIVGFEKNVREDTRFTLEGYYKTYENFPLSPDEPQLFIIDEMVYSSYFFYHPNIVDEGEARSYGVEAILQKKLRDGLYGLISASWFRSQYKDLNGDWRNRSFDNRVVFSAEGGYKPNKRWEFSLRWIYAGGAPYTPLDMQASMDLNRSVYDFKQVNEARYPDYHSLNIRVDRRFNFSNSNMIVYLSIWNAYNRENVAQYFWNEHEHKQEEQLQWSMLPIFGIEFEF